MNRDAERTLEAVRHRYWWAVLLFPRTKFPAAGAGESWPVTADAERVAQHLAAAGNVGLLGGERNGLAIVDVDDEDAFAEMEAALGPLGAPWVETGSGKRHFYLRWEPRLPAKLRWHDVIVGEVQRGPGLQQCVCPPSLHPVTGRRYTWLVEPATTPLPRLSARWRQHLVEPARPEWRRRDGIAAGLADAALAQPGARRRPSKKIKFQCPACRAEGHDEAHDNAVVFEQTGTWGCAWATGTGLGLAHWQAIGEALGALAPREHA